VPERDGILDLLPRGGNRRSRGGARLRTLLQELYAEVGRFVTKRLSVRLEPSEVEALQERLEQPPGTWRALAVIEVKRLDGLKLILEDGSWLLFRFPERSRWSSSTPRRPPRSTWIG